MSVQTAVRPAFGPVEGRVLNPLTTGQFDMPVDELSERYE